jgi:hypothetical protein
MVSPLAVKLDEELEETLYDALEQKGFTCLENAVDPAFLTAIQCRIDALLAEKGSRYFSVVQPHEVLDGEFAEIAAAPGFVALMRRLAKRLHSDRSVADFSLYNVLRVIAGEDAEKTAFQFHYDATVLTILMPLYIPSGPPGKAGDLVALPNDRQYRSSALLNIGEKMLKQNPLSYRYYARRYGHGERSVYKLKPGNLYFFNGYRTFHGNLPCEAGQRRATLIFHFGDPHAGNLLTKAVLSVRKFREERRLRAAG